MYLCTTYPPNEIRISISDDASSQPFAEIKADILEYTKDPDEPTESALVRLLVNLENFMVELCKRHDPCADEYSLHEEAADQLKKIYPCIQSAIRLIKRRTATHRDLNLKNLRKELNLK